MFVRWKRHQLTASIRPDDLLKGTDYLATHPHVAVEMSDGSVAVWETGVMKASKWRHGKPHRWHGMEKRNVGKGGVMVEGDIERWSYHAQLVESRRLNGQPRQRIVAYLGTYQTGDPDNPERRVIFWEEVGERLATLNVSDEVKARIEDALAQRMPRPTAEDTEFTDKRRRELAAWGAAVRAMMSR